MHQHCDLCSERENLQRKAVDVTRVQKDPGEDDEYWPLRSRLLSSCDLYFSQLAIVSEQTKRSSNFQLNNTYLRILLFNNMHCSVTQNGELAFEPI